MSMRGRFPALILIAVLGLFLAAPGFAQDAGVPSGTVERSEQEIADMSLSLQMKYMSPYCPGSNLRDCTSGKAAVLREEIKGWVAAGWTEEQITDELISRYGESILSAPRFEGFNMLVWIFPVLAVLVGLGVILWFLQRQQSMKLHDSVPTREVESDYTSDPDLERRLERELSARSR